jgi:hypothetical protein
MTVIELTVGWEIVSVYAARSHSDRKLTDFFSI